MTNPTSVTSLACWLHARACPRLPSRFYFYFFVSCWAFDLCIAFDCAGRLFWIVPVTPPSLPPYPQYFLVPFSCPLLFVCLHYGTVVCSTAVHKCGCMVCSFFRPFVCSLLLFRACVSLPPLEVATRSYELQSSRAGQKQV